MRIALIQQHTTGDPEENRARGKLAFLEAAKAGAGLVAFAELAFSRFYPELPATPAGLLKAETIPGPTTDLFCALARETSAVAVLNLFERDGERTYDTSPVIDADGRILGVTRMVHIMEGPGFHERGYYAPGDRENFVYATAAGKIGVAICYDRHFPEYMRGLRPRTVAAASEGRRRSSSPGNRSSPTPTAGSSPGPPAAVTPSFTPTVISGKTRPPMPGAIFSRTAGRRCTARWGSRTKS